MYVAFRRLQLHNLSLQGAHLRCKAVGNGLAITSGDIMVALKEFGLRRMKVAMVGSFPIL